jgi:glycosyltransferase involved in cell wall biosynthesis
MVFHVLSIPLHPTRKEITLCAFTQKVYKFCKVMTRRGHTVFHYGHPDSHVPCTKHFDVVSRATYNKVYKKQQWQDFHLQSVKNEVHEEFNKNSAALIKKNKQEEKDFVLAFWGFGHRECCEQLKDFFIVEPSVGYDSGFAPFKVFETYAQLHKLQFSLHNNNFPSFTDHVIRPGFYFEDFTYQDKKQNYLLFLGRMINNKGIDIAQNLSKASSTPIKFVGPQNLKNTLKKDNPLAEYIHTVSNKERKELLANAKALIMPTLYVEPCGWSMLEAFISGTPVISTDWGGLAEYNIHGKTGFRCRSLNEFYHALNIIETINPKECRLYAEENFTIDLVAKMYENYFEHLITVERYGLGVVQEKCNFLVK